MSDIEEMAVAIAEKESTQEEQKDYLEILQTINPKIARAIQLHLTGAYRPAQIADMLGVSIESVRKYLSRPESKKYIQAFQRNEAIFLESKLKAQASLALEKMGELLNSPIDGVKFQAAKDLLDRAGFKPEQKVNKQVTVQTYEQKLASIIQDTVEVEYEEVADE